MVYLNWVLEWGVKSVVPDIQIGNVNNVIAIYVACAMTQNMDIVICTVMEHLGIAVRAMVMSLGCIVGRVNAFIVGLTYVVRAMFQNVSLV